MPYDPTTLWILVVFIMAMMSTLLVLTYFTTSPNSALLHWSAGLVVSGISIGMIAARGHVPNFVSIEIANATLLLGGAIIWNGFRIFDGRPVRLLMVLAAPAAWVAACQLPVFAHSIDNRVMLMSVLMILIELASIRELLRGGEHTVARRITVAVLSIQAIVLASRIVAVRFIDFSEDGAFLQQPNPLVGFYGIASVGFLVVFTFAVIAMVRDRRELTLSRASLADELTGLLNRRGFMSSAPQACRAGQPFAVLALDLDHFKYVNDRHGHATGDALLVLFGRVLRAGWPAPNVTARTGGEEFGVLMPGASAQDARDAAERVRLDFRQRAAAMQLAGVAGTVSIGVAVGEGRADMSAEDIGVLFARADAALYVAKAQGRDRVETARPEPHLRVVGRAS